MIDIEAWLEARTPSGSIPVVVEMSGNHSNSKTHVIELVNAANDAGASAFKVQAYTANSLIGAYDRNVEGGSEWIGYGTYRSLYSSAATPWDWIEDIFSECDKLGLPVFGSAFCHDSVNFLSGLGSKIIKIASPEFCDLDLIEATIDVGCLPIVSTGVAYLTELDSVTSFILSKGSQYALMKCESSYPAQPCNQNTRNISYLKDRFGVPVGFSDHTIGYGSSMRAILDGATFIEKHFKLDGDCSSVDASFSQPISTLPEFVKLQRDFMEAGGAYEYSLGSGGVRSRDGMRSLYFDRPKKRGEVLEREDVVSLRPGLGLSPLLKLDLVGKTLAKDVGAGDPCSREHFDW